MYLESISRLMFSIWHVNSFLVHQLSTLTLNYQQRTDFVGPGLRRRILMMNIMVITSEKSYKIVMPTALIAVLSLNTLQKEKETSKNIQKDRSM